jgi:hypothetical protein
MSKMVLHTGSSHRKGLRADLKREDFASDNPSNWTPGAGEEEDVDAYECDECLLSRLIVGTSDCSGDCDNELADSHTDGTEEEEVTATPLLHQVKTRESRGNVDAGCNHSDDEGVRETGVLEEGSTIVN